MRNRQRRGGPRTPLPLLPVIAVCCGIAVAYVSQTAHATQATYEATQLGQEQQDLRNQDQKLGDELDRLRSGARIVAAAQSLGMRPAGQWDSATAQPLQVVNAPHPIVVDDPGTDDSTLQQLVASLLAPLRGGGR